MKRQEEEMRRQQEEQMRMQQEQEMRRQQEEQMRIQQEQMRRQQEEQQSSQSFPDFPATAKNSLLLLILISTLVPLTLSDVFAFKAFTIEFEPLAIHHQAEN